MERTLEDYIIFDPLNRLLSGVIFALLIMCATLYLYQAFIRENKDEKIILYGFTALVLSWGISSVIGYFMVYELTGYYVDHVYYYDWSQNNPNIEANFLYSTYLLISMAILSAGLTLFTLSIESRLKRTKYLFTMINMGCSASIFLLPIEFAFYLYSAVFLLNTIVQIGFLYEFLRTSSQNFKIISLIMIIGLEFLLLATGLDQYINLFGIPIVISSIFWIVGILLWMSPLFLELDSLSRFLPYWKKMGNFFAITLISYSVMVLAYGILFLYVSGVVGGFFGLLASIYIRNTLQNSMQNIERKKIDMEGLDLLRVFSRPLRISKEEISLSQSEKLCLVCKGELSRMMYLCPECNSFYCGKCSIILKKTENLCWVCNSPIDENLPVRKDDAPSQQIIHIGKKKLPKKITKNRKKLISMLLQEEKSEISNEINLTLISSGLINNIEALNLKKKQEAKFIEEILYLSLNERDSMLNEIFDNYQLLNELEVENYGFD
jgi:hypothetical protein